MTLDISTQAADPTVSAFVTAHAGSGKTYTLVQRVARLLLREAAPDAILCVTYTRAAAAEMQRRLFQRLGEWAVASDETLLKELAALDERGASPRDARRLFAKALETPGGLKIQTIHALCEKVLRRFPLESGVPPRFEVVEGAAASALARDARIALANRVLAEPESDLAEAYRHLSVELHAAGFEELLDGLQGKNAELAAWMADPADRYARVWRRCGFEDGQAVDPKALQAEALGGIDTALWLEVADVLDAARVLDKCSAAIRRTVEHRRWADALEALCTKEGELATWPEKNAALKKSPLLRERWLAERERFYREVERSRAAVVARDTCHVLTLGEAYRREYETLKQARRQLDFADLVAATHRLLQQSTAAWVLYKLDGGVEHILLDEAQDTAPEQWEILEKLTDEFFSGDGVDRERKAPRTMFAVGDVKQSIYSFQGAQPEKLQSEQQRYDSVVRGVGQTFKGLALEKSWRSTPEVLAFVDKVFEDPALREAVPAPEGQNVVRHLAHRDGEHGSVDLWTLDRDVKAGEPSAWDPPTEEAAEGAARRKLARRIAGEIKAGVERGELVGGKAKGSTRPMQYGDVLILVRRRDALFEEVIRQLKLSGVPVAGADRMVLSDHILFKDLLALARVALFPRDDLTLAALLRSPFFDVGEESLYRLARGRLGSLWDALRDRADEAPEWRAAFDVLRRARTKASEFQPYDFFARFLAQLDGEGRSMRARVLKRLGHEATDALESFLGEAILAQQRGIHGLEAFAASVERSKVEVKRDQDDARGEVRVMTVHGAKGLEAPIVYLPDTAQRPRPQGGMLDDEAAGLLYAPRQDDDCEASREARLQRLKETQEESLRLLYVALTRARDRLVICGRVGSGKAEDEPKPEQGSWYEFCRNAFDQLGGVESRTLTDGTVFRRYGVDPVTGPAGEDAGAAAALPGWATRPPPEEPPEAEWAQPSQVAAASRRSAPSPLETVVGLGRYRRGDLIHSLLETLPELPVGDRAAAAARMLARHDDLTPEQREEMAGAALAVLADPQFAEVFGPGSRPEVAIAGGAPGLPPKLRVSGRVDRLVVTPERVLVVDYKTNRPAPSTVEAADPAYLDQMAVYVAVLRAIFPGRRVEAALVWTEGPRLMPVPEALVAERLGRLTPQAA